MISVNTWPLSQTCTSCKSAIYVPIGFGDGAYICLKAIDADGEVCMEREENEEWLPNGHNKWQSKMKGETTMANKTERGLVCPNCGRHAIRAEEDYIGDEVLDISLITIFYRCLCCGFARKQY